MIKTLSVLDQSPIPAGAGPAQALANSVDLARHCEALGYFRYWVAEHHSSSALAGSAPAILIGQIESFLESVRKKAEAVFPQLTTGEASLIFHVYGKNAVMGELEPLKDAVPHEVGLMGEVTAATQDLANAICSQVRINVLHMPYPGQLATAGNFAIPLNPPENPIGPVCKFSVYHLMEVDSPADFFPVRYSEI